MFSWKDETAPRLKIYEKGPVTWLAFEALEALPGIRHGFSTRLGGVSEGHLASMNLSFSRGDDPDRVKENYRRIGDALGIRPEWMVCSDQTHTTNVMRAGKNERGYGVTTPKLWHDVDGMVTNEAKVALCTSFADCVPLYFVDPVHKAIGLSHSGWKGTVGKIGRVTLEKMQKEFGTDPARVIAAIGPSICQDCYEVSEDVILQFKEAFPEESWSSLFYEKANGKYQLDLWQACRYTLLEAGIKKEHLSMPNLCTCCNPRLLFSHRASKGQRGNLNAFLMLE